MRLNNRNKACAKQQRKHHYRMQKLVDEIRLSGTHLTKALKLADKLELTEVSEFLQEAMFETTAAYGTINQKFTID